MTEERSGNHRLKMLLGMLIPIVPGAAFVVWFESNYGPEVVGLPMWLYWTIGAGAFLMTGIVIIWALRGGIPPQTRMR